jgi:hypothetical protein
MAEEQLPRIPDAVIVPVHWRGPSRSKFERANAVLDKVEPLLGVGVGGAHARPFANGYFVTRSPYCTLFFPKRHPLDGQPRYDWVERPELGEGVRFGYLKPEALESAELGLEPTIDHRASDQQVAAARDRWREIHAKAAADRTPVERAYYKAYAPLFHPDLQ